MKLNWKYFSEHVFSDASLEAMCMVAYLRAETESSVQLCFDFGECGFAPLKQQTIPKRTASCVIRCWTLTALY